MRSLPSSVLAAAFAALAAPTVGVCVGGCTRMEPQATVAPDGGVGTAADKSALSVKGSDTMVVGGSMQTIAGDISGGFGIF